MNTKPVILSQKDGGGFADGHLAELSRAELDQQIATAKNWPRDLKTVQDEVRFYATLNVEAAEACYYSLPRKQKQADGSQKEIEITGPSIRFAEILAHAYGNCRFGARIVRETDKFIVAQGMFFDLQRNVASTFEVQRGITYSSGGRYNNDMIAMTGNAAGSIALRNAVLHGIPRAIWEEAYLEAFNMAERAAVPIGERWKRAVEVFGQFKVTEAQLLQKLGLKHAEAITGDHIKTLIGWRNAIKESQTTVEELFSKTIEHEGGKTRTVSAAATASQSETKKTDAEKKPAQQKQSEPAVEAHAWTEVESDLNNALLDASTAAQIDEVAASFEDSIEELDKAARSNARKLIADRRKALEAPADNSDDDFPGNRR